MRLWSTLRRAVNGATALLAVDALAARGMLILSMFFAARILGVEQFGQLSAVYGTIVLLAGLASDALRLTVTRQVAAAAESDREGARATIGFAITASVLAAAAASLLLWLLAPFVANAVLGDTGLTRALQAGALVLVFEATGAILSAVLLGLREFRSVAIGGVASGLPLVPAVVVGAQMDGVAGVVWGLAVAQTCGIAAKLLLVARVTRRRGLVPSWQFAGVDRRFLWRLSLPAFLSGLSWAPINWLGVVMLVNTSNGFAQMGLLGIAMQWFAALLFLPNLVGIASLPVLSAASLRRDQQTITGTVGAGIVANLTLTLPAAALIAAGSGWILPLYGPGYEEGRAALMLLAAAAAVASSLTLLNNLFAAVDRMWDVLRVQLVYGFLFLTVGFVLLQRGFGAAAIAAAMLVGYAAKLAAMMFLARRTLLQAAPLPASPGS